VSRESIVILPDAAQEDLTVGSALFIDTTAMAAFGSK